MTSHSKNSKIKLNAIVNWLNKQLAVSAFSDRALNGLQVDGPSTVTKVALAVDATAETFQSAINMHANLLIVHHGLFWGEQFPLVGHSYKNVKLLMDHGLALYAAHLPLDAHAKWGNNIVMAKKLHLNCIKPFGQYGNQTIGFGGVVDQSPTLSKIGRTIETITNQTPTILNFGNPRVKKIAIVSGGAGSIVEQAYSQGYDTFLTGEFLHQHVHLAKELAMNIIIGGHYATETLGVKAIGQAVTKKYQISAQFLDHPTGF